MRVLRLFGWLSDRIGRKKPIVIGYALTLVLLFPLFWGIGRAGQSGARRAPRARPGGRPGPGLQLRSVRRRSRRPHCGQLLDDLSALGIALRPERGAPTLRVSVGGEPLPLGDTPGTIATRAARRSQALAGERGYELAKQVPPLANIARHRAAILVLIGALSGMTYGPVAALLSEMFPPRIRYSSMSIPYHIGTGYFGGFLPLIASYIVALTGDPFAGLWYTGCWWSVALVVAWWGLPVGAAARFCR